MAIKGYCAFLKPHHHWNLTIRLFSVISRTLIGGWSYPSAEVQSVYSTAPTDGAIIVWNLMFFFSFYDKYTYLCFHHYVLVDVFFSVHKATESAEMKCYYIFHELLRELSSSLWFLPLCFDWYILLSFWQDPHLCCCKFFQRVGPLTISNIKYSLRNYYNFTHLRVFHTSVCR